MPSSRFGRGRLAGKALDFLTFFVFFSGVAAWRLWRLARRGDIVVAKIDLPLISAAGAP